jgi:hypothetical protein
MFSSLVSFTSGSDPAVLTRVLIILDSSYSPEHPQAAHPK